MERSLQFLLEACSGESVGIEPAQFYQRVCTDTRAVQPGDLFIALRGERFNGNAYAAAALQSGAVAAVVDEPVDAASVLRVADARVAYGQLAAAHRREFELPVFGVAGSNGKTSTKDMLASVLGAERNVLRSEASFNNDVGVPATLLKLGPKHEAAVVELGTNHPGELAPLVQMTAPDYGVLTGIGREHLEFFGDLQGVAQEEGMVAELLPSRGKLFLYGDGDWVNPICQRTQAHVIRVGFEAANDWQVKTVQVEESGTHFSIRAAEDLWSGDYFTPLIGRHQASNAALALAAGASLGMNREAMARGLAASPQPRQRLQWAESGGVRWLNDAYNANADSVRASLETLGALKTAGRRFVVFGEMAELGEHSEDAHREAGELAASVAAGLVAIGQWAEVTAETARAVGLKRVEAVSDAQGAANVLREWVQPKDVVLLKASRAAKLEQIMDLY